MAKSKEDGIVIEGLVVEAVKGNFKVQRLDAENGKPTDHFILAHIAGKLRQNNIKIVLGDRVQVEITPYDLSKGRITYRMK